MINPWAEIGCLSTFEEMFSQRRMVFYRFFIRGRHSDDWFWAVCTGSTSFL